MHGFVFHGFPWKIFHGIPWSFMEFHGVISHAGLVQESEMVYFGRILMEDYSFTMDWKYHLRDFLQQKII